ncbi:NAD(P)-dependent oxidoreductase [Massilia sp. MB5]|uniref:NAD-dependent epimerase/dehydratase family protein n=1 Tax=Massilia sp. MB5 TaxID=2919578 RepID=UPI001F0D2D3F|nr:NAD(P)-dependent oxidoreductase [Massilia sp. MB5]UMR31621.1 NAD(P)-dependent oxidoreductase [Massilia sp. MB5]
MNAPSVLLTGASGFIGAALAHRLVREGWQVHLLLRPGSGREGLDDPALHIYEHDGSTAGLIEIVRQAAPQGVFHLASLFLAQHTAADIERLVQSNVLFSTQLAEAMAANGVKLLVNAGTSWQHYADGDYNPVCLYAATKQAFEAILRYYAECAGLRVCTLKLFDTYGPEDKRPKLLHLLKKTAQAGTALAMSPGCQLIDLVYIDDVLDAFLLAYGRLQSGAQEEAMAAYGISSGAPLPLKELAALYSQVSGLPLDIEWGGRPYRLREVMVPWTRYPQLPGWHPKISLAEGIARTLAG